MLTTTQNPVSIAEYLSLERAAFEKSEFHQGRISPRTRPSIRHNVITGNVLFQLHDRFHRTATPVYGSDLRIAVPSERFYTYADVVVLSSKAQVDSYDRDTVTNLLVVCEVFSDETEAYDGGAKFRRYSQCPTLMEYLLVAENGFHVERRVRRENGGWLLTWFDGLDAVIDMIAIRHSLPLRAIYEDTERALDSGAASGG